MIVLAKCVRQRNSLTTLQLINRSKKIQPLEHSLLPLTQLHRSTATMHAHRNNEADAGNDQRCRGHDFTYQHRTLTNRESRKMIPLGRGKPKIAPLALAGVADPP